MAKRKKKIKYGERPAMGRIPTAPGIIVLPDKKKYNRKRKHRKIHKEE